ncbi:hypothetical protein [Catenulispora pinistramenti]|nr:hypothetical protein [Catenulispora pinistramenti]
MPITAVQKRFNLLDRSGVQLLADCEAQGIESKAARLAVLPAR